MPVVWRSRESRVPTQRPAVSRARAAAAVRWPQLGGRSCVGVHEPQLGGQRRAVRAPGRRNDPESACPRQVRTPARSPGRWLPAGSRWKAGGSKRHASCLICRWCKLSCLGTERQRKGFTRRGSPGTEMRAVIVAGCHIVHCVCQGCLRNVTEILSRGPARIRGSPECLGSAGARGSHASGVAWPASAPWSGSGARWGTRAAARIRRSLDPALAFR